MRECNESISLYWKSFEILYEFNDACYGCQVTLAMKMENSKQQRTNEIALPCFIKKKMKEKLNQQQKNRETRTKQQNLC